MKKGKLVRQRMKQCSETATAASTFADLLERALAERGAKPEGQKL